MTGSLILDFDAALNEALDANDPPEFVREVFIPDTEEKVNYVLGRLADLKARAARIRANADAMIEDAEKEAASLEARFHYDLKAYAERCVTECKGKTKTFKFLNGQLSLKKVGALVVIPDGAKETAKAWAAENVPEALEERVTVHLDMAKIKERLTFGSAGVVDALTGEAIEWAEARPEEERLYIR